MVLNSPRILPLRIRLLEPLTRLDAVFSKTHKRDNSLRIEAPSIVDSLQKLSIQSVKNISMLLRGASRLINRFKSHKIALALELLPNLTPDFVELVFDLLDICARSSKVEPFPRVVVDIHDNVEAARSDLIKHGRHTFEPA